MVKKKYDIVALGELLIDFTMVGLSEQYNPIFEANPGGAPCNVLAMMNNLGKKTAFIGKVGKDYFGKQLRTELEELGIDISYLYMDDEINTTLALVHTAADGDRDFSFYRNPGADMMLTETEIPDEIFHETGIFHFGTLSMTHETVRAATKKALSLAKENGVRISFDPNLRPPLWSSLDLAKEQVLYGLEYCDILKISDNEIQWLTGLKSFDAGVKWIQERYPNISLILLTLGKEGSRAYHRNFVVKAQGFLQKNTTDTTGAGDVFCGSMLYALGDKSLYTLTGEETKKMLTFANAAASIITTRKGALKVTPSIEEINKLLLTRV